MQYKAAYFSGHEFIKAGELWLNQNGEQGWYTISHTTVVHDGYVKHYIILEKKDA